MFLHYLPLLIILGCGILFSVLAGKLTVTAALTGAALALLIFTGAGYTGIAMMTAFFILGSAATSWKMAVKRNLGLAETNKGKRNAGQVIANAGIAGLLGLLVWLYPGEAGLLRLMMAAGLASATADTLSSELGNVYGRRFYNILNFKKDERGLNGVISLEGTCCGICGSAVIALIYAVGFGWNSGIAWIIIAGTIGNLADSILGATLERRGFLNNNAVNFLNTLIAALVILLGGY